ncbi:MAG: hypothetical protein Q4C61_09215 [Lachnospiraceae bacterium]|nr:hypothetical protein [Lachnospiraceae bacterium]
MKRKKVVACLIMLAMTSAFAVHAYAEEPDTAAEAEQGVAEIPTLNVSLHASEGVVTAIHRDKVPTGAYVEFTLEMPEGTNSALLDTENAVVRMTAGDGYRVEEFVDPSVALDSASWSDGKYVLNFDEEVLESLFERVQVQGSESEVHSVGGPSWSQFGGNGNGQYFYNLTVSGITYDGAPIEDTTFRVCCYCYDRDASDKARITLEKYVNVYDYQENGAEARTLEEAGGSANAESEPVWTWIGDDSEEKPILCDTEQDDFYISWPEGVDASGLTASDISVTLYGQYGDELKLTPDCDYYVYAGESETQIALPFVHMAFTPVYTDMAVSVDPSALSGAEGLNEESLTQNYDVASVYVYQIQFGGLNPNGAVLVYQFYGFDDDSLTDWSQILHGFEYALFVEQEDGSRLYYSEENGGSLVESIDDASTYDATGAEDLNIRFVMGQAVIYDTTSCIENEDGTVTYRTETKTVDGEEMVLNKVICKGWDGNDLRGVQYSPSEARANGLRPARGFAFPPTDDFFEKYEAYSYGHDYWVEHSMWPWVEGIEIGWLTDPSDGKANWNGEEKGFGFEYAGDGYYPDWTAPEAQEVENWWPWLRSGDPEGMWEAVDAAKEAAYGK